MGMNIFRLPALAVAALVSLSTPVLAHEGIHVTGAYARVTPASAAVYFVIENHGPDEDRLLSVTTDAAAHTMLHANVEDANGVMQMLMIEGGIAVPGNTNHALEWGGAEHLMLTGLTRDLTQGDVITLTLTFENEGAVVVEAPVDNARKPGEAAAPDHDAMDHSGN
jgi:periplasmic copper chaperone A